MKELIEIAEVYSRLSSTDSNKMISLIESEYLRKPRNRWLSRRLSEQERIALDILELEKALDDKQSLRELRFTSNRLSTNTLLREHITASNARQHQELSIRREVIEPNRHFVSAAVVARMVRSSVNRERLKWISTAILTSLTALLAATIKILGDIHDKLP